MLKKENKIIAPSFRRDKIFLSSQEKLNVKYKIRKSWRENQNRSRLFAICGCFDTFLRLGALKGFMRDLGFWQYLLVNIGSEVWFLNTHWIYMYLSSILVVLMNGKVRRKTYFFSAWLDLWKLWQHLRSTI